ncbi:MAG: hypothetical protein IJ191_04060 [Treponema sp.]|nr:hypothetical protein [Treponema sp.]
MLLPGAEKYLNKSSRDLWTEQLANDRLILSQIDAAIVYFNSPEGADGISEYTIDTGQDRQTIKRTDIGNLMSWKNRLVSEIAQLERSLGLNGSAARRIVPGF